MHNDILWMCAGCQNLTGPSSTHSVTFVHPQQPVQFNEATENTCNAVQFDWSRCRSANKHDLRFATVRPRQMNGTLSSTVAVFDDHVVNDVTARGDITVAPVDRVEHVSGAPPNGSRDRYFRSQCEADAADCATQQSQRPSTCRSYEHIVDALRDCRLTSYDAFPFPVLNEVSDVSADEQCRDNVVWSDDCRRRRRDQRVSESSGSITGSDSTTSGDISKSLSRLVLCRSFSLKLWLQVRLQELAT